MKWIPLIAVILFACWPFSNLRKLKPEQDAKISEVTGARGGWPVSAFGSLPVVYDGRLQPIDSLARNTLLMLRKKQTLNLEPWRGMFEKPEIITATEWIAELMMNPEVVDTWPCFRIDNPDVKGLLNLPMDKDDADRAGGQSKEDTAKRRKDFAERQDGKHYRWNQIVPHYVDLVGQAEKASRIDSKLRNPYQNAVLDLTQSVNVYRRLKAAFGPAAAGGELSAEIAKYRDRLAAARAALDARENEQPYEEKDLDWLSEQLNAPILLPPVTPDKEWSIPVHHVRDLPAGAEPHPALGFFGRMSAAWKAADKAAFETAAKEYQEWIRAHPGYVHKDDKLDGKSPGDLLAHTRREQLSNVIEPFYCGMVIAVFAFLFFVLSWFDAARFEWSRRLGVWLMWLVFGILTLGIIFRMWQEGRPPVTNLYSSALLIGWGAVLLGLILEMIFPLAIGGVVAAKLSFGVLLVAHFLSLDGDTMIMLQAVLDTNYWLATHVVIVTLGYMATFVAGGLGVVYLLIRGVSGSTMTKQMQRTIAGMAFAIVCFGTLFSFVGTVLGGLWADQSWGRFWGWDPKENGALMIVLWNALILHARLGGIVRERGLLVLCIGGNIVTSWSWFGTNMLGVGLHSYGFMDSARVALLAFVGVNLVLMGLGMIPPSARNSFRSRGNDDTTGNTPQPSVPPQPSDPPEPSGNPQIAAG